MKSLSFYLDQMNQLLDQLIGTAKSLRDLSVQVVSEEELTTHQDRQKEILIKLEAVDKILEDHFWNEIEEKDHRQLHGKVHLFQTMNQEFIQNLRETHGLIQFELSQFPSEDDYEDISDYLNKLPAAPKISKKAKL